MSGVRSSRSSACGFPYDHEPTLPAAPTSHKVGTWERIEVMRLRAEAGEDLWHPDDQRQFANPQQHAAMKAEINRLFKIHKGLTFRRVVHQ